MTVYRKEEGQWTSSLTGDFFPFKTREVNARSFSFVIKPPIGEVSVFYVRVTGLVNRMLFSLSTPTHLQKRKPQTIISLDSFLDLS